MNLAKRLMVFRIEAGTNVLTWLKEKVNEYSKLVSVLVGMLGVCIIATSPDVLRVIDNLLTPLAASSSMQQEGKWERLEDMKKERMMLRSININDVIYAIGGTDFALSLANTEVYDIKNNVWLNKSKMNVPRWQFGLAAIDNNIYASGGADNDGFNFFSSFEVYDTINDTWTLLTDMPVQRAQHTSVALGDEVYIIGGTNAARVPQKEVYAYNTKLGKWVQKKDIPESSAFGEACSVNGKIYYMGGVNFSTGQYLDTVYEYTPNSDKWVKKMNMPHKRASFSVSVVEDKIYAIGGTLNQGEVVSWIDIYDPINDKWLESIDMEKTIIKGGLVSHSSSAYNGAIYIIGGSHKNNLMVWSPLDILKSVYKYNIRENLGFIRYRSLPTTWGYLK